MISRSRRVFVFVISAALWGCSRSPTTASTGTSGTTAVESAGASATAESKGLSLTWEIGPGSVSGHPPMRTVKLRFRNTTAQPMRIALPQFEPFRSHVSDLSFTSATGSRFFEPQPRPHGYVLTELDFPEIAPGEEKVFTQSFTLDPVVPGGAGQARRPGFERGTSVAIVWTYQNSGTSRPGGVPTLDGVTKPLFGGGLIPGIWTGKLEARGIWTIPD